MRVLGINFDYQYYLWVLCAIRLESLLHLIPLPNHRCSFLWRGCHHLPDALLDARCQYIPDLAS